MQSASVVDATVAARCARVCAAAMHAQATLAHVRVGVCSSNTMSAVGAAARAEYYYRYYARGLHAHSQGVVPLAEVHLVGWR